MMLFRVGITSRFIKYSDRVLTILLLVSAAVIVLIALFSKSPVIKAVVLGWILLP